MFEELFSNQNVEKIMFYIIKNKKCYAGKLARIFNTPVVAFQRTLQKLERAGILVNYLEGRTRVYTLNPRYTFKEQIVDLFKKGFEYLPEELQEKYIERNRPRRTGKPL